MNKSPIVRLALSLFYLGSVQRRKEEKRRKREEKKTTRPTAL